jgi:hypothetical protein
MKTEIITIDRTVARRLLARNKNNRNVKERMVEAYYNDMKSGRWKENGESIIIDKNGIIKDGQHRLMAIEKADVSINFVVVTDVEPNVMDTIDTGSNRSLADVLALNKFKNANNLASLVRYILVYKRGFTDVKSGSVRLAITNAIGLDYASKNEDGLTKLLAFSHKVYARIPKAKRVVKMSEIGLYTFIFSKGFEMHERAEEFMNYLTGYRYDRENPGSWVYDKLLTLKTNKEKIGSIYRKNLIIKAWQMFLEGKTSRGGVRADKREPITL